MSQNIPVPLQPQQPSQHESLVGSNQLGQQQSTITINLNQSSIQDSNTLHNTLLIKNSQNYSIINQQSLEQQKKQNQSLSSSGNYQSSGQVINNSKNQIDKGQNLQNNSQINPDTVQIIINSKKGLQYFCFSMDYSIKYLESEPTLSKLKEKLLQQRIKKLPLSLYISQNQLSLYRTNKKNQNKNFQQQNVLELLNQPRQILQSDEKQQDKQIQLTKEQKQAIYKKLIDRNIIYKPEYNYLKIKVYLKKQNQQKQFIKQYQLSRDIIELTKIRYEQKGMQFNQKSFIQQLGILFSMYNNKSVLYQIKAIQTILLGEYHQNQKDLIKTIVSFMLSQNDNKSFSDKIQQAFNLLQKFLQDLTNITDKSSQLAKQFEPQILKQQQIFFPFIKGFFISKLKQMIKQPQPISLSLEPVNLDKQNSKNILFSPQLQEIKKREQIEKQNKQQKLSQSLTQEIQNLMVAFAPKNILNAGTLTERLKLLFFIAGGFQNISHCFRAYDKSKQAKKYKILQEQIVKQKPMVLDVSFSLTLLGFLSFDFDLQWNDVGVLDLQDCSIKDQVFAYMIKHIHNFPNLRTLYLKNNKMTKFTAQYLQNIKNKTKTTYINLQQNDLNQQSRQCIRQFLFQQQKSRKEIQNNQQQLKKPQNRIITIQF